MTGLLIVTHGNFGKELLKSCEMIFGEIPECKAFGLARDKNLRKKYSLLLIRMTAFFAW